MDILFYLENMKMLTKIKWNDWNEKWKMLLNLVVWKYLKLKTYLYFKMLFTCDDLPHCGGHHDLLARLDHGDAGSWPRTWAHSGGQRPNAGPSPRPRGGQQSWLDVGAHCRDPGLSFWKLSKMNNVSHLICATAGLEALVARSTGTIWAGGDVVVGGVSLELILKRFSFQFMNF